MKNTNGYVIGALKTNLYIMVFKRCDDKEKLTKLFHEKEKADSFLLELQSELHKENENMLEDYGKLPVGNHSEIIPVSANTKINRYDLTLKEMATCLEAFTLN
jgi:hypothetical protein